MSACFLLGSDVFIAKTQCPSPQAAVTGHPAGNYGILCRVSSALIESTEDGGGAAGIWPSGQTPRRDARGARVVAMPSR